MTSTSLFRPEVFDARRQSPHGEILLIRPVSFTAWTLGASAILAATVGFAILGSYTERATVNGFTISERGVNRIVAPQRGIVIERKVEEGDRVRAGEELFVLSSERFSGGSTGIQARILEQMRSRRASLVRDIDAQREILQSQAVASERRLAQHEVALSALRDQIGSQERRVQSVSSQLGQYVELQEQGFYGSVLLQQRRDEVLEQEARLQALRASLGTALAELASMRRDDALLPMKALRDKAAVDREIAQLDQDLAASEAAKTVSIVAPQDGTVTAVLAARGQTTGDQPLLTLLPAGTSLQVMLYVPSRAIGFVTAGQPVRLRFAAYPYQKFGQMQGRVLTVSRSSLQTGDLPDPMRSSALQSADGFYQVTVGLERQSMSAYGRDSPLNVDMKVEADIMLDERRLYEWMIDPLVTLKGRI